MTPTELKLWNVNAALQRRQDMAVTCILELLEKPRDEKLRAWANKLVHILRSKVVIPCSNP